jgi:pimeloyl-ACP methyl ester carboxylesterase
VNIVLAHGGNVNSDTWNRVVKRDDYPPGQRLGGQVWGLVVEQLSGQHVFAPTLLDEREFGLSEQIEQIVQLIEQERLEQVVLVGHSYGGMVITGVAAQIPDQVERLVYVDAALPQPGQSLFMLLESVGFAAQDAVDGMPKAYLEPIQFSPESIEVIPKTYVFCTRSEFTAATQLAREYINANPAHWTAVDLPTNHLPMATMPRELTEVIL